MTYDQYQQLYSAAKEQIAARVAQVQPTAGNGASVNGMGIAVEVPVADEAAEEDEDWVFVIRADTVHTSNYSNSYNDPNDPYLNTGPETFVDREENQIVGTVGRASTTGNVLGTYLFESLQITDVADGAIYKTLKVTFRSGSRSRTLVPSAEGAGGLQFADLGFQFPVRLFAELREAFGAYDAEPVEKYTFDLRFSGQTKNFIPPKKGVFELYLVRVERLT